MSEQPEAFQLAAELERTDSPLRRPDTVALRAAELLRQQWQDIQHVCAAERDRAIEHTRAVGEKVLLIREQHAEIERLRAEQLPTPPEECQTEAEKKAFAFGYWSGVAAIRARGEKP